MIPIELYVERARSIYHEKKDLARVGRVASTIIDVVAFVCGLFLLQVSNHLTVVGIAFFFIIFGGYGVLALLYHVIYSAILRGLEAVVGDEVVEE